MGLQQAGGECPSERHSACLQRTLRVTWRIVPSAFSTIAGERAMEFVRQAEADDGEDLVQPLQDAARDARFLMLQTPGQVAQQPFGLVWSSWSQA